jgi:hypothetical protein
MESASDNERLYVLSLTPIEIHYLPQPDISLFITKLTECQNTNYVMIRSVNLPHTVTNKRNHVVEELVDDLI